MTGGQRATIRRILSLSAYAHANPQPCSWVPLEGMSGGPRVPADRPKSNQMGQGPHGAGGPFVTVICPAAKITNTFFSEGPAATGLRALMPPSCGHAGPGAQGRSAQSCIPKLCSVLRGKDRGTLRVGWGASSGGWWPSDHLTGERPKTELEAVEMEWPSHRHTVCGTTPTGP